MAHENNQQSRNIENLRTMSTGWIPRYEAEVYTVDIRAMKEGFVH